MSLKDFLHLWLLSTCILIVGVIDLNAQTRSNPFEIKPRLKSMQITDTFTPVNIVADSIRDTIRTLTTSMDADAEEKNQDKVVNPFDVDHIPIKQSAITKRVENLKAQTDGTQASNGFLFWFILFSSAVLALVINTKSKALSLISKSIFNENMLKLFQRDESKGYAGYLYLLYVVFLINISVFIYLALTSFGFKRGISSFLVVLVGSLLVYGFKHLGLRFIGNTFLVQKNTDLYNFTIMIFNHFVGMILIPINLLLAFGPTEIAKITFWISVVIIAILLIIRYIRGIFTVSEHIGDRFFQIIIYLCAFEILPVLILIKTVSKYAL